MRPNNGVDNIGSLDKKFNDPQKGPRPNSGSNCIFLENDVGLLRRDWEKVGRSTTKYPLDSNTELKGGGLRGV